LTGTENTNKQYKCGVNHTALSIQAAKRKTQTEIKTYEGNVILKPVCRNFLLDKRTTRTTMKKFMFYDLK